MSKSLRGSIIYLEQPKAPNAHPGKCRWCGTKLIGARKDIRRYCKPDREGRDCAKELKKSITWNTRYALRWLAAKEGKKELVCVDCGKIVEELHRGSIAKKTFIEWDADHDIPLWKGGSHTLDNLRVRCRRDHKIKTAKEANERSKIKK